MVRLVWGLVQAFYFIAVDDEPLYLIGQHGQTLVLRPGSVCELDVLGSYYHAWVWLLARRQFRSDTRCYRSVGFDLTSRSLGLVHLVRDSFIVDQVGIVCEPVSVSRAQHFHLLVADIDPGISQDVFS